MGERTNILLENDNIYLYAHWIRKEELLNIVKYALIRGQDRWTDRPYLNRIIFSELIQEDVLGTTGFGLSSCYGDGSIDVKVNIQTQTVNGIQFNEFIRG